MQCVCLVTVLFCIKHCQICFNVDLLERHIMAAFLRAAPPFELMKFADETCDTIGQIVAAQLRCKEWS